MRRTEALQGVRMAVFLNLLHRWESAELNQEEAAELLGWALKEVFSEHGLPTSLYTDRGSHYFRTTKAGEIDRGHPTQVGRALEQLGVEHIGAFSPQARGRSERAFGTLQDRLVKELKLAGIATVEAANAFIREVYLPAHNARFAVDPAGEGSAFTPIPGVDLDEILCVQEERQVMNDNRVSYWTLNPRTAIRGPMRPHFVRARVKVPRLSRRIPRPLSRAALHRPIWSEMRKTPLKSARRRELWRWGQASSLPTVPQQNKTRRSGHLMGYQNRTT